MGGSRNPSCKSGECDIPTTINLEIYKYLQASDLSESLVAFIGWQACSLFFFLLLDDSRY